MQKVFNTNTLLHIVVIILIAAGVVFLYFQLKPPPPIGADQLMSVKQEKKEAVDSLRMADKEIKILKDSISEIKIRHAEDDRIADSSHIATVNAIVGMKNVKAQTIIVEKEYKAFTPQQKSNYILNRVRKK